MIPLLCHTTYTTLLLIKSGESRRLKIDQKIELYNIHMVLIFNVLEAFLLGSAVQNYLQNPI